MFCMDYMAMAATVHPATYAPKNKNNTTVLRYVLFRTEKAECIRLWHRSEYNFLINCKSPAMLLWDSKPTTTVFMHLKWIPNPINEIAIYNL